MRYLLAVFVVVVHISCRENANIIHEKLFKFGAGQPGVAEYESRPGHYYFKHDSIHNIAFIDTLRFTEEQLGRKIILEYSGRIRTDHIHSFASIKIVLLHDQESIHWSTLLLRDQIADLNKWNDFKGYFVFPYHQSDRLYNKVMIYTELTEGKKEQFDIDSVTLTIKCASK